MYKRKIIVLLVVVLFVISAFVIYNYFDEPTNVNQQAFRVIDNYDREGFPTFSEVAKEEDILSRFKQMNEQLNSQFEYIEVITQSLEYIGKYSGDEKFVCGENKESFMNQELYIADKKVLLTPINAIQLNQKAVEYYGLVITKGEVFDKKDFIYTGQQQEVLLGYNYKEIYKIGDILKFNYLEEDMNFKVKGFLNENSIVEGINIDDYIIMPSFKFENQPSNEVENSFQIRCYSQKNNGYIIGDLEKQEEYFKKIDEISQRLNLNYTIIKKHN